MRLCLWVAMGMAASLVGGELFARGMGLLSFPVYERAAGVEYYLRPSQHGAFLGRNPWAVNAAGFNNVEPFLPSRDGCILIGDSIVYGGNPVAYRDRVGPLAQKELGSPVWTGAAGGWSLMNELAFARMHRSQILATGHLVFVINDGDLVEATRWGGELGFPTQRPLLGTLYLARRYMLQHTSEMPAIVGGAEVSWQVQMDALLDGYQGAIAIVEYADQAHLLDAGKWRRDMRSLEAYVARNPRIRLIDSRPAWSTSLYKDTFHPTVRGDRVLASYVAQGCRT